MQEVLYIIPLSPTAISGCATYQMPTSSPMCHNVHECITPIIRPRADLLGLGCQVPWFTCTCAWPGAFFRVCDGLLILILV